MAAGQLGQVSISGPVITGTHRKEAGSAAEEMVTPPQEGVVEVTGVNEFPEGMPEGQAVKWSHGRDGGGSRL